MIRWGLWVLKVFGEASSSQKERRFLCGRNGESQEMDCGDWLLV